MNDFAAIMRQLSVNRSEDGFDLFCEVMQAEADELRKHEGRLRREVARLALIVPPASAYTHPAVLVAARRLEDETGCLLIGPALGWLLHVELAGRLKAPGDNPLTDRILPL